MKLSRMGRLVFSTAAQEHAAIRLAELIGPVVGTLLDPYSMVLTSARGFWSHSVVDVQKWTGHYNSGGVHFDMGSWEYTLTEVARGKGVLIDNRKDRGAYTAFEIASG